MDLAKQKEIIEELTTRFNLLPKVFCDLETIGIESEWFVYDGDKWLITRNDGKKVGNYFTFEKAVSVLNALIFYMG